MRIMSLRSLARNAPGLGEAVLVSHGGRVIGRFLPLGDEDPVAPLASGRIAAAPAVDAPAERPTGGHGFGRSRPAPKPGGSQRA